MAYCSTEEQDVEIILGDTVLASDSESGSLTRKPKYYRRLPDCPSTQLLTSVCSGVSGYSTIY